MTICRMSRNRLAPTPRRMASSLRRLAASEDHGGEVEARDGGDDDHERDKRSRGVWAKLAGIGACTGTEEDDSLRLVACGAAVGSSLSRRRVIPSSADSAVSMEMPGARRNSISNCFAPASCRTPLPNSGASWRDGGGDEEFDGIDGERAIEFGRRDADDGYVLSVEADRLPDYVGGGVEAAAPVAVADDYGRGGPGFVEVGAEESASLRVHAEDGKVVRRDKLPVDALGLPGVAFEVDVEFDRVLDGGGAGEEVLLLAVVFDVGVGWDSHRCDELLGLVTPGSVRVQAPPNSGCGH